MSAKVTAWLETLGLGQYAALLEENDIDWELLPTLDPDILKDIGIRSAGHRLRICKAAALIEPEAESDEQISTTLQGRAADHSRSGEDISSWSRTPGERKPVTMLFADIVDSTAITEYLDAEEAHDLLYRGTRQMCEAVENNQGTVCRLMGDGIMAMFGAPLASEHHALEACRAALQMQNSIAADSAEIQVRVGLHSGEVVVLEVGDNPNHPEYDASGPTVPLAARMEQAASPGNILITASTRALASNWIETEALPAISVKGVTEPVEVYALHKIRSAVDSSSVGMQADFVGRRAELAQFRGLIDESLQSQQGQTIYLRGEPGIGKTRLVGELAKQAQTTGFQQHRVLVLDFGTGKGQEAMPALLRSLLGIKQGSGRKIREQALQQALQSGIVEADELVYLNDLLDLGQALELRTLYDAMEASARLEGKRNTLASILARLAARNPILLVIEGLHWADAETLEYLVTLGATVAANPMLMIMTARLEGDPIDTNWRARSSEHPIVTWDLGPLRREEALKLASSFKRDDDQFVRDCIERAEGNPLFLEQLLLGGDQGLNENLPDSIKSMVLSRLDHLSGQDKQALRAASILGQRFTREQLCHLVELPDYNCQELINHHLVRPDGSLFMFAHALIQGGIYTSLLKSQRAELHRRAAAWFEQRDILLYAVHLDRAGDSNATAAYLRAAQKQSELYRPERALQLVQRGLEIAPEAECFALGCLEGELLLILGKIPESIAAYRLADESAEGEIGHCQASIGIAQGLAETGAHEELLNLLEQAELIAEEQQLLLELAQIYQIRGNVQFFRGQIDACLESNKKSLGYARQADSAEVEAQALSGLGNAEYNRGRFLSAHRYFDQCIELAREHGLGRIIAANLSMRAYVIGWQNDFESTISDYREAIEQASQAGDQRAKMLALVIGGSFWAGVGNLPEGEKWLSRGLAISQRIGSRIFEGVCHYLLARFAVLQGDREQACRLAQAGVEILREQESGMTFGGPISLGVLALALEDPGLRRDALAEAEALLKGGSVGHNYLNFYEDAMDVCLQTRDWDEVDRYAQALADYTLPEPLPRSDFIIARGRALAAFGRGSRDTDLIEQLQGLRDEAKRIGFISTLPALEQALDAAARPG